MVEHTAENRGVAGSIPALATRTRGGLVAVLLLAALAAAAIAGAKEGVVARLENPAALRAPAGTAISLDWTLLVGSRPFGAGGIYVRVRGCAGTVSGGDARWLGRGRYRARVVIPRGGARSVGIGLRGWTSGAGGTRRADMSIPILNRPELDC